MRQDPLSARGKILLGLLAVGLGGTPGALGVLPLPLQVSNRLAEARSQVPVTWGIPLALGDGFSDPGQLTLLRGGEPVPVQLLPLARWGGAPGDPGRPIAWLLADLQLDLAPGETAYLTLVAAPRTDPPSPLRVAEDDASGMVIETGAATYALSRTAFRLFDSVILDGGATFSGGGGLRYQGSYLTGPATMAVEQQGPERLSILVRGTVESDLEFTLRLHFFRDLALVKADLRLENLAEPETEFGQPRDNDYGSFGSRSFDDFTLVIPGSGPHGWRLPAGELGAGGEISGTYTSGIAVVQQSSGDENWNRLLGEAPRLQSGVSQRASTRTIDGTTTSGPNQLAGWLDADGVTVAVEALWQSFPKALRAATGKVEVGLFPGEFSRLHELRAGEFKTHTVWIRHHGGADTNPGAQARSLLTTARLLPSVANLAASRAAGLFAPRVPEEFPDYEAGVNYQLSTSPEWTGWDYPWPNLFASLSEHQAYGWVDYGDVPTDFERTAPGVAAPFNHKYEGLRGFVQQALRSDDERWWELARAGARHAADIDLHHSRTRGKETPRNWFEGGIWGHGYHNERGNTNPHRNYMNPSVSMHFSIPGMFLWGWLSGDTLVLDAAREAAENTYWRTTRSAYADDGGCATQAGLRLCNPAAWECVGYAEFTGSRDGGNVVKAMLAAYLDSGDAGYLDLVRRAADYLQCWETTVVDWESTTGACDRFHFQATFLRELGHYMELRLALGLADDSEARALLARRMTYMTGTLWNPATAEFRMCYGCADPPPALCPLHDNWLLAVADAFAVGGRLLDQPQLLTGYGRTLFLDGAANPFYLGSPISYHSAKELVNEVGFGGAFMDAYFGMNRLVLRDGFESGDLGAWSTAAP